MCLPVHLDTARLWRQASTRSTFSFPYSQFCCASIHTAHASYGAERRQGDRQAVFPILFLPQSWMVTVISTVGIISVSVCCGSPFLLKHFSTLAYPLFFFSSALDHAPRNIATSHVNNKDFAWCSNVFQSFLFYLFIFF